MSNEFLHTFDREEADLISHSGKAVIEKTIQIPLLSINRIVGDHFSQCPNFVSLDTEGLDECILKSFNFSKYRPEIMCLECVDFSNHVEDATNLEITKLMEKQGYMAYASTHINTIFVDSEKWKNRNK
ncbi:MAG TPA: hypothetical protein ENJ28_00660 [Gammaproteobacteria bacterium]|nr:hypothetical protein [Gammaproteobacteria bacterium]